jgi:hypothetical protein
MKKKFFVLIFMSIVYQFCFAFDNWIVSQETISMYVDEKMSKMDEYILSNTVLFIEEVVRENSIEKILKVSFFSPDKLRQVLGYIQIQKNDGHLFFNDMQEARLYAIKHSNLYSVFNELFDYFGDDYWYDVTNSTKYFEGKFWPQYVFDKQKFIYIEYSSSDETFGTYLRTLLKFMPNEYVFTVTIYFGNNEYLRIIKIVDINNFIMISPNSGIEKSYKRGASK